MTPATAGKILTESELRTYAKCSQLYHYGGSYDIDRQLVVIKHAFERIVADAIRKAGESSRKNILDFELEETTIPHEVISEWDGARVLLKPAKQGTGVIAGSQVRSVLEIGGVKDVVAKSLGCNNPINQVYATFKALGELKNRKETLAARGIEL